MSHAAGMPIALRDLLDVIDQPASAADLRLYFGLDHDKGSVPPFTGGRFEGLAGGGDRPETANIIAADDVLAVQFLSVIIPGPVALALIEGPLGREMSAALAQIPTNVSLGSPAAEALVTDDGPASRAWDLLDDVAGVGWVTAGKLMARKRPALVPVYDRVVRCALERPKGFWTWLDELLQTADGALERRLLEARDEAGVPETVTPLRVLDVIIWMRHRPTHVEGRCPRHGLPAGGSN